MIIPFPHQDPAVQPTAQVFVQASYVPGMHEAVRAIQDADTSLLGRAGVGDAMALHRHALGRLRTFAGGAW